MQFVLKIIYVSVSVWLLCNEMKSDEIKLYIQTDSRQLDIRDQAAGRKYQTSEIPDLQQRERNQGLF